MYLTPHNSEIYIAATGLELAGDQFDLLFGEHGRVAIHDGGNLFWIKHAYGIDRVFLNPPAGENKYGLDRYLSAENLREPAFKPDGAVAGQLKTLEVVAPWIHELLAVEDDFVFGKTGTWCAARAAFVWMANTPVEPTTT